MALLTEGQAQWERARCTCLFVPILYTQSWHQPGVSGFLLTTSSLSIPFSHPHLGYPAASLHWKENQRAENAGLKWGLRECPYLCSHSGTHLAGVGGGGVSQKGCKGKSSYRRDRKWIRSIILPKCLVLSVPASVS